jgi:hypothetical protein
MFKDFGATHITLLHTKDRAVADSEAFVKPIASARSSVRRRTPMAARRLYLHTRTQREVERVLIAAASSRDRRLGLDHRPTWCRGAVENNFIMMAPGYEEGFGLMKGVAIDHTAHAQPSGRPGGCREAPGPARHRP